MSTANNHIRSQKQWPALLAALGITFVMGLLIIALGANALFNKDVVPVLAAAPSATAVNGDQATIEQLQSLIVQYQDREVQYQTELQQAADQLTQSNAQLQQYQGLVAALQNAGVIQIAPNGQIFLGPGAPGGRQAEHDDD